MNDQTKLESSLNESKDGVFDAIAAVALVVVFVATCILWVSSQ